VDRGRVGYLKAQLHRQRIGGLMKVLLVFAHPEPRSLNAALRDAAVAELEAGGHRVQITDLYAACWKSEADRADFPMLAPDARMRVPAASREALAASALTEDVKAEIEKLLWADALILQFPLWWFSMPAILKGWVDRVFACGLAYGVGEHSDTRMGDRYGDGAFAGKRAMLIVTAGGWEEHYAARGINGPIDDLLFPIHHGILYFPGYEVLPPFVAYKVDRLDDAGFQTIAEGLRADADAGDHPTHSLPAAERRRLPDPGLRAAARPGRPRRDRICAPPGRRRR